MEQSTISSVERLADEILTYASIKAERYDSGLTTKQKFDLFEAAMTLANCKIRSYKKDRVERKQV